MNTYEYSGLTDRETMKINGYLSPERIEALIDNAEEIARLQEVDSGCLNDSIAQYPEEDFLQHIVDQLRKIAKADVFDPDELDKIADELEGVQDKQSKATEYGRSVIRSYLEAIAS